MIFGEKQNRFFFNFYDWFLFLKIQTITNTVFSVYFSDIGMVDDEGFCTICGRIKDIIIRGGENINPLEVEQVMYTHPKIKDVQV